MQVLLLTYLQSSWQQLRGEPELVSALKECAFVATSDGAMKKPADLYDPSVDLFSKVGRSLADAGWSR